MARDNTRATSSCSPSESCSFRRSSGSWRPWPRWSLSSSGVGAPVFVGVLAAAFVLQLLKEGPGGPRSSSSWSRGRRGRARGALHAHGRLDGVTVLAPAPLCSFRLPRHLAVSKLVFRKGGRGLDRLAGHTPVVMLVFDELSGSALIGPDRRINSSVSPLRRLARTRTGTATPTRWRTSPPRGAGGAHCLPA